MRAIASTVVVLITAMSLYLSMDYFKAKVCESLVKEYEKKFENVLVDFDNKCVPLRAQGSTEYGTCVYNVIQELNKLEQEVGLKIDENDCTKYIGKTF